MENSFEGPNYLEKSISSVKFSIPKQKRFLQIKPLCGKFYEIKPLFSDRTTTLGYGKKTSLIKKENIPGPASYNINRSLIKENSIQFSLGREVINFKNQEITKTGPGQYQKFQANLSKQSYTMGLKLKPLKLDQKPGPGRYDCYTNSNSLGKTHDQKDSIYNVYSYPIENQIPGIGQYYIDIEKQNIKGTYYQSQYKSTPGKTFFKNTRSTLDIKNISPGPGSYNLPSMFG